jgi:hypothetical protein
VLGREGEEGQQLLLGFEQQTCHLGCAALERPGYAGQQLVTGPQAATYANHFIAVHLSEVAGGKTYAQVSAAALAAPTNATLKTEAQTLFQGTTLRGLLLNAYAFGTVGKMAGIAAIVAFVGGGVILVLSILGFAHGRGMAGAAETAVQEEREVRRVA